MHSYKVPGSQFLLTLFHPPCRSSHCTGSHSPAGTETSTREAVQKKSSFVREKKSSPICYMYTVIKRANDDGKTYS